MFSWVMYTCIMQNSGKETCNGGLILERTNRTAEDGLIQRLN